MRKALALLCAVALLSALFWSGPRATAEGYAPAVRVLLRRLALTDRADLKIEGNYSVAFQGGELSLPANCRVTVQIREDQLCLSWNGINLLAGDAFTFFPWQSAQASTGIRFQENGGLYPGQLKLSVAGGQLHPVLTLSVEDYLLGVLPWEMSDSFPIEALKAQAICARTYALSRINAQKEWDLVDTTNDQVFRGVNAAYGNTARAVRETAGIVGVYAGKLAECYYSASNGGQTELVEHVWSAGGSSGCYAIQDDPYDLENPESIVRNAYISRDASRWPTELVNAVYEGLMPQLSDAGWETGAACFKPQTLLDVRLGGYIYGAPSRFATELTLTFTWSGRKMLLLDAEEELDLFDTPKATATLSPTVTNAPAAADAVTLSDWLPGGQVSVTLSLFSGLTKDLGLSIGGMNNEMISLVEQADGWRLESRRFGHGVGMSQRGAQWMAGRYGKTFDEILRFYYPGMTLMVGGTETAPLPTPPSLLFETPGPSASPTPRPTLMPVSTDHLQDGAWLASVEGVADDSTLNLRAEPSPAAEILMRLYKHQLLVVLESCENPEWVHVKTDSMEGYVMVSFLERMEQMPETASP